MPMDTSAISPYKAPLSRRQLRQMLAAVRLLYRLQATPGYRRLVASELPETARFDPGHDAVMMGYDFHLTDQGPKLIEVNTNAGGAMYAFFAAHPELLGKCPPPSPFARRLLQTFVQDWWRFSGRPGTLPRRMVIIDEDPPRQNLYPEMECFQKLFAREGIACDVVDPGELRVTDEGVFLGSDPVDFIYNRHCDFYLETESLAGLRSAWLNRQVCLSPHPCAYGLLADKRRMIVWSDPQLLAHTGLTGRQRARLLELVPESRLLAELDPEQVWQERKNLVFKPVDRFGGKGVLLGRSTSRKRFAALVPERTLVQKLIPPSLSPGGEEGFKTDYRVYAYRDRAIGVAARLWRGQLTNLSTPEGGFAAVELVD